MAHILNGKIIRDDQVQLYVNNNGSFWYGDGFFEVIKYANGKIHFAGLHWERIVSSCAVLKMKNPFTSPDDLFNCVHLLAKESTNPVQRIKIVFWRNTMQGYRPENNDVNYLAVSAPLADLKYPLNETGLKLGIYTENLKPVSKLSTIKSNSSQLLVLATLFAQENNLDDSIILNTNRNIIETGRSNIFMVNGRTIYTPPLNEGCLDGIMRRVVLDICNEQNISIQQVPIRPDMLDSAEEVFISSSVRGVQWVSEVDKKSYTSHLIAEKLSGLLNEMAKR